MVRFPLLVVAALAALLVACGGDQAPPRGAGGAAEPDGASIVSDREGPGARDSSALQGLFASVFGGVSGADAATLAGESAASLEAYLPAYDDLPDGFLPLGAYSFAAPATNGAATDMAVLMAMRGGADQADPSQVDLAGVEILAAMVLRPEDGGIGAAFEEAASMSAEEIERAFVAGTGGVSGLEIRDFRVIDTGDLGEDSFGIQLSVNLALFNDLFSSLAPDGDVPQLAGMTTRMLIFRRGEHIGTVSRISFTDRLGGEDEDRWLAAIVDGKLPAD
ncbi:MAG TPA: hypothetical protein VNM91_09780 [Dehalococcoidia bacterium]|nr:hypothetical protein [Dehalococcoidia bacterium]